MVKREKKPTKKELKEQSLDKKIKRAKKCAIVRKSKRIIERKKRQNGRYVKKLREIARKQVKNNTARKQVKNIIARKQVITNTRKLKGSVGKYKTTLKIELEAQEKLNITNVSANNNKRKCGIGLEQLVNKFMKTCNEMQQTLKKINVDEETRVIQIYDIFRKLNDQSIQQTEPSSNKQSSTETIDQSNVQAGSNKRKYPIEIEDQSKQHAGPSNNKRKCSTETEDQSKQQAGPPDERCDEVEKNKCTQKPELSPNANKDGVFYMKRNFFRQDTNAHIVNKKQTDIGIQVNCENGTQSQIQTTNKNNQSDKNAEQLSKSNNSKINNNAGKENTFNKIEQQFNKFHEKVAQLAINRKLLNIMAAEKFRNNENVTENALKDNNNKIAESSETDQSNIQKTTNQPTINNQNYGKIKESANQGMVFAKTQQNFSQKATQTFTKEQFVTTKAVKQLRVHKNRENDNVRYENKISEQGKESLQNKHAKEPSILNNFEINKKIEDGSKTEQCAQITRTEKLLNTESTQLSGIHKNEGNKTAEQEKEHPNTNQTRNYNKIKNIADEKKLTEFRHDFYKKLQRTNNDNMIMSDVVQPLPAHKNVSQPLSAHKQVSQPLLLPYHKYITQTFPAYKNVDQPLPAHKQIAQQVPAHKHDEKENLRDNNKTVEQEKEYSKPQVEQTTNHQNACEVEQEKLLGKTKHGSFVQAILLKIRDKLNMKNAVELADKHDAKDNLGHDYKAVEQEKKQSQFNENVTQPTINLQNYYKMNNIGLINRNNKNEQKLNQNAAQTGTKKQLLNIEAAQQFRPNENANLKCNNRTSKQESQHSQTDQSFDKPTDNPTKGIQDAEVSKNGDKMDKRFEQHEIFIKSEGQFYKERGQTSEEEQLLNSKNLQQSIIRKSVGNTDPLSDSQIRADNQDNEKNTNQKTGYEQVFIKTEPQCFQETRDYKNDVDHEYTNAHVYKKEDPKYLYQIIGKLVNKENEQCVRDHQENNAQQIDNSTKHATQFIKNEEEVHKDNTVFKVNTIKEENNYNWEYEDTICLSDLENEQFVQFVEDYEYVFVKIKQKLQHWADQMKKTYKNDILNNTTGEENTYSYFVQLFCENGKHLSIIDNESTLPLSREIYISYLIVIVFLIALFAIKREK